MERQLTDLQVYIERLEEEKRPKVANYKSALNSFLQFTNGKDIPITEITTTVIKDYEDWLLDKGLVRNSTSAHMRSLQAIYKHLMAEQHLKITDNPFSVVYRGIDKVEKNILNLEQIRLIKDADLHDKPKMAYARDLFMFAFYTHASMVDIAYMKPQDIKMGVLFYKNHRGGETEMVKWEKVMSEIVQRYALSCKRYLLPIITDESEATLQHKRASNKVNNQLAKLGESIGLPFKLAMDVARDSWQAISRSYFDRVNGMILADLQGNISDTATTSNPKNVENRADSHSPNKTTPVENEEVSVIEVDTKGVEQLTQPTEQPDYERESPNTPEEPSKDKETQQEEIKDIKPKRIKKMQDASPRKSIKQDNLWNSKWQAYMDYLDKNKRRPSKYKKEDMVLVD